MKWKLLNLSDNHSDDRYWIIHCHYNYIRKLKLKFIIESTNKMLYQNVLKNNLINRLYIFQLQ